MDIKDIVKKLNYILDKKQKLHIFFLGIMIFIGGILETISVSAVLPIISTILDKENALQNKYIRLVMETFNVQNVNGLITIFIGALIVIYIVIKKIQEHKERN